MVSLTFAYALRLDERIEPFWIVSMMMSAGEVLIVSASLHITASWPAGVSGAIHMKCAALLYYPLLSDRQKDLKDRIATEAANWLTVEEREALEQHGIQTGRSKADEKAKGDPWLSCPGSGIHSILAACRRTDNNILLSV